MWATQKRLEEKGFRVDSSNKMPTGWWLTANNRPLRRTDPNGSKPRCRHFRGHSAPNRGLGRRPLIYIKYRCGGSFILWARVRKHWLPERRLERLKILWIRTSCMRTIDVPGNLSVRARSRSATAGLHLIATARRQSHCVCAPLLSRRRLHTSRSSWNYLPWSGARYLTRKLLGCSVFHNRCRRRMSPASAGAGLPSARSSAMAVRCNTRSPRLQAAPARDGDAAM